jgi:predicted HTH domain antitoxin
MSRASLHKTFKHEPGEHLEQTGRAVVTRAYNASDSYRWAAMLEITMKLDEDVLSALRRSPDEFANEMRLAAAIHWYKRGEISQEKAAQVSGLDRTDFLLALAREGEDAFVVDFADLERELQRG